MKLSIITPWAGSTVHLCSDYFAAVRGCEEVVLIDNASDAVTAAALRNSAKRPGATHYLRNPRNVGFAQANNQGYAHATGEIFVFLNSDVSAPASTWCASVRRDVQDGHLYGPSLQRQFVYGMWLPYLEGWCIAATRATWERLMFRDQEVPGPWDAAHYPEPYWEDNDLCLRAMMIGIDLVPTKWAEEGLIHKGGGTIGPMLRLGEIYERNRATFAERARKVWEMNTMGTAR